MSTSISNVEIIEINPVGSLCNLGCTYCNAQYLRNESDKSKWLMKASTLEQVFTEISTLHLDKLNIHWYGGEPLLAGIDFYSDALKLQQNILNTTSIINSLNTNGLLLNKEYLDFFKTNKFLLSVSLDGANFNHNKERFASEKQYNKVLENIDLLKQSGMPLVIALVVKQSTYKYAKEILQYLKGMNVAQLRIFPCFHKNQDGHLESDTIDNEMYFTFLKDLFDGWINSNRPFKIGLFSELIKGHLKGCYSLCYLSGNCSSMNIDRNGNVYSSCEVQTEDTYLGKINSTPLSRYIEKHKQRQSGLELKEVVDIMGSEGFDKGILKSKGKYCYQYFQEGIYHYYYVEALRKIKDHINNSIGKL
ncbi:MAG: radical SAM protein [Oligoflexia bacterium]|nr:radical SAM protein [Oligoflexia bacterium]